MAVRLSEDGDNSPQNVSLNRSLNPFSVNPCPPNPIFPPMPPLNVGPQMTPRVLHRQTPCVPFGKSQTANYTIFHNDNMADPNLWNISLEYKFSDLLIATQNFNPKFRLGQGSYGDVYRGTLPDGTNVAVKVIEHPRPGCGFHEELSVLSRFRHPNLVILMGFSRDMSNRRYLVFELLEGGSLFDRLYSQKNKKNPFLFTDRVQSLLDAALGLSHLHGKSSRVIHRDIKSQNILLDRRGTAKVADFGLALLANPLALSYTGPFGTGVFVDQCSGTVGYADPLYITSHHASEVTDVYSFGMLILEVLCGTLPALILPDQTVKYNFKGRIENPSQPDAILEIVDKRACFSAWVSRSLALLALRCVQPTQGERPRFSAIVRELRVLMDGIKAEQTAAATRSSSIAPANPFEDPVPQDTPLLPPAPVDFPPQPLPEAPKSPLPVDFEVLAKLQTCPAPVALQPASTSRIQGREPRSTPAGPQSFDPKWELAPPIEGNPFADILDIKLETAESDLFPSKGSRRDRSASLLDATADVVTPDLQANSLEAGVSGKLHKVRSDVRRRTKVDEESPIGSGERGAQPAKVHSPGRPLWRSQSNPYQFDRSFLKVEQQAGEKAVEDFHRRAASQVKERLRREADTTFTYWERKKREADATYIIA